jgi:hypothetical protein
MCIYLGDFTDIIVVMYANHTLIPKHILCINPFQILKQLEYTLSYEAKL